MMPRDDAQACPSQLRFSLNGATLSMTRFSTPRYSFREHDERALGLSRAELAASKFSPFIAIIYRPMNNPSVRECVALAR